MNMKKIIACLSAFTIALSSGFVVCAENSSNIVKIQNTNGEKSYNKNVLFKNTMGVGFDDSSMEISAKQFSSLAVGDKIIIKTVAVRNNRDFSVSLNGISCRNYGNSQYGIIVDAKNISTIKSTDVITIKGKNAKITEISVVSGNNQVTVYDKNKDSKNDSGSLKINAEKFDGIKKNDRIILNVLSAEIDGSEELFFNSQKAEIINGRAVITVDSVMASELRKNGCVITGSFITVKSVSLEKAQEDVNYNLDNSVRFDDESIKITANEMQNVKIGDMISIKKKNSEGSISVRNSGGNVIKNLEDTGESVDFIIDSGNIDDVKNGIEISGKNVTVSEVVLKTKVTASKPSDDNGNQSELFTIIDLKNKLNSITKSGSIIITNTPSENAELYLNIYSENGEIQTVNITVGKTESKFSFSSLSEENFKNLKSYGCYITGKNIIISGVAKKDASGSGKKEYSNFVSGNSNNQSVNEGTEEEKFEEKILSNTEIKFDDKPVEISAGNSILNNLSSGSKIKVKAHRVENLSDSFVYFNGQKVAVNNDYAELAVDENMLSQIKNNGLTISGKNILIASGEGSGISFNYGDKTEEIYSGEKALGKCEIKINANKAVKSGDDIIVEFDKINSSKKAEISSGNFKFETNENQGVLRINDENLSSFESGFTCVGINADIKKIIVKSNEKEVTINKTEKIFDDEKIIISGDNFSSAESGDIIRIKGEKSGSVNVTDGEDNVCYGLGKKSFSNGYVDYIIDNDILAIIKRNGIRISGENVIISEVDLLEQSKEISDTDKDEDETDELQLTTKVSAPGKVSGVTAKTYENKINLSWKKVNNAYGYCVYRYDYSKKKYVTAGYTTKTSFTAGKLKSGTRYTFAVKAYVKNKNKKIFGKNTIVSANTKPFDVKSLSVKTERKKAVLKWKKSSTKGCTYRIYARISPKGKYRLVKNTSKTSATVTGLKTGKKYNFMVKSVKKISVKSGKKSTVLTLISKGVAGRKSVKIK